MLGVSMDVSERKQREEGQRLLADASSLLAASLDYEATLARVARLAVPDFADLCILDLLDTDGKIQRAAAAHADPTKTPLVETLQRHFPPDPCSSSAVPSVLRTGRPQLTPVVTEARLADFARDPAHIALLRELQPRSSINVPLVARGRILGALTFVAAESGRRYGPADLTTAEELAVRAALAVDNARLYREARDAVRARDEFLTVAAHELKTPITSLRGFAQLAQRQAEREGVLLPPAVRRALQIIDQQSDRLTRLIGRLLDIGRIEAGRLTLDCTPTEVVGLVRGVVATAQAHASQHPVTLQAPPELWALVDPLRLEQVVSNLVDNAIKYSPEGSPIEIDVATAPGDLLCLAVADRGRGIAPEDRGRVFDRFYRARAEDHLGGLGIGLYVSRQIVELHGGHIEADALPEGGTRFVVRLPLQQQAPLASQVGQAS
jgi:signal transduction histidine kinase